MGEALVVEIDQALVLDVLLLLMSTQYGERLLARLFIGDPDTAFTSKLLGYSVLGELVS